jgi:hypothetical protein
MATPNLRVKDTVSNEGHLGENLRTQVGNARTHVTRELCTSAVTSSESQTPALAGISQEYLGLL